MRKDERPVYQDCRRRWAYRYLQNKVPQPQHAAIGAMLHAEIESSLSGRLPTQPAVQDPRDLARAGTVRMEIDWASLELRTFRNGLKG